MDEPLLTPTLNRFILFPIKYPDIWKMAKQQEASFWSSVEIDMNGDRKDLLTLSVDEQNSIKKIIAFFAAADGIVNENLSVNFSNEIQCSEGRYWYRIHASEYECYHFLDNNDVYSPYSDHELSEFLSVNSINANNANNTRDYNVNMNINDSRLISFSDRTITTQSVENRYLRNTNNNTNKLPELSTYIKDLIKNSIKAGDECIVCTEILSEMDKSNISVRNCGHIFCTSCYDKTLNKCPICNKS